MCRWAIPCLQSIRRRVAMGCTTSCGETVGGEDQLSRIVVICRAVPHSLTRINPSTRSSNYCDF
jgi:hypothetical protein